MKKSFHNKGFSIIEMLIYLAVLAVIFIVFVSTVLSFTGSYRSLNALRKVENSGLASMERMTRDIRDAATISSISSNSLTVVATRSSISTTTRFYLQNNILNVDVNGVFVGPLTVQGATVNSLTFTQLTSTTTKAVKIDMTVQGSVGPVTQTKSYHTTVVLKGS